MINQTNYQSALKSFRLPQTSVLEVRTFNRSILAMAEIRGPANHGLTAAPPLADAYILQYRLQDCPGCDYFDDGIHVPDVDRAAGVLHLHDLRRSPTVELRDAFHIMHAHFPVTVLKSAIERSAHIPVHQMALSVPHSFRDTTIEHLFAALRPSLARPEEASALFVEQVSLALCIYLGTQYGGLRSLPNLPKGGLAPWQERRVKEMIDDEMSGELSLSLLALECQLSVRHFSRAFLQSFGMPAHQYQLRRRIDRASHHLLDSTLSLQQVALACGFSTQSHLSRVFFKLTGVTPGAWRRLHRAMPRTEQV